MNDLDDFCISIEGAAKVPVAQIEALLTDLIKSHSHVAVQIMPGTNPEIEKVLKKFSDLRWPIGLAWDEIDLCIFAWTNSASDFTNLEKARRYGIRCVDLTNWLDDLYLDDEDIYHCE